jgi:hypothetical protein
MKEYWGVEVELRPILISALRGDKEVSFTLRPLCNGGKIRRYLVGRTVVGQQRRPGPLVDCLIRAGKPAAIPRSFSP